MLVKEATALLLNYARLEIAEQKNRYPISDTTTRHHVFLNEAKNQQQRLDKIM